MSESELNEHTIGVEPQDEQPANLAGEVQPSPQGLSRGRRVLRAVGKVARITSFLFATFAGLVFGNLYWGSATFRDMFHDHWWGITKQALTGRDLLGDWVPDKEFKDRTALNVLVLGVDREYDDKGRLLEHAKGRSDSILIARFDFLNKRVDAVTIPRDTAVKLEGSRYYSKINAAHSKGGPELVVKTLQDKFGIPIDAFVRIDLHGFVKLVDALGGIDLTVTKALNYDDNWGNLHVHLKPGFQHMTGYQAMGFVRIRKIDSDEMRSKRQHAFIEAMRDKVKSPSMLLHLPNVLEQITDSLTHPQLTNNQLFTLVNFAKGLPKENIRVEVLPSFEGPSFVAVDVEKASTLISEMFFPGQSTTIYMDVPSQKVVEALNSPFDRTKKHSVVGVEPDPKEISTGPDPDPAPAAVSSDATGTTVEPPPTDSGKAPEGPIRPTEPSRGGTM